MKRLLSFLLIGIFLFSGVSFARGGSYYKSSSKSYSVKSYSKSPTYKIGKTSYYTGKTYKKSGLPIIKRSEAAKEQFLRSKGLKKIPTGYQIDHIIPLSQGGADTPENMQLLPIAVHKQKTASERGSK